MTSDFCNRANDLSYIKSANKKVKQYKKKEASKSTKKLLYLMAKYNYSGKSLLDIGGDAEAIQQEFHQYGGAVTTVVGASKGYLQAPAEFAKTKKQSNINFISGDFVEVQNEISEHEFLTLNKVICCYPDYKKLLLGALEKTTEVIAISIPIGGIIFKILSKIANLYFLISKSSVRNYIHDPKQVHAFITDHGFELSEKALSFPWIIRVYERAS